MTRHIRRARPDEADALRALAHRSKAYWPYSAEFLERAQPFLTLDTRDVEQSDVWVLEVDNQVAGWHRVTRHGARAELEDLWLEPAFVGSGLGRILFEHAAGIARRHAAERLEWDAEPYAEGFYRAMGGEEIGRTPSEVVQGRTLPRMRLDLRGERQPETRNR
ncbi:MAG TPA: GNAT family N-acetyltransferase [Candidatus Limnocylindria bacterium]|nr:GNAT family N-acetyltransferase [Candidatus Limnocylindria bacterium]